MNPETGIPDYLPLGANEVEHRLCLTIFPSVHIPRLCKLSKCPILQNSQTPARSGKVPWHGRESPAIVTHQVPIAPPVRTHMASAGSSATRSARNRSGDSSTAAIDRASGNNRVQTRSSGGCIAKTAGTSTQCNVTPSSVTAVTQDDSQTPWYENTPISHSQCQRKSPIKKKLERDLNALVYSNDGDASIAEDTVETVVAKRFAAIENVSLDEPPVYLNSSGCPPSPCLEATLQLQKDLRR